MRNIMRPRHFPKSAAVTGRDPASFPVHDVDMSLRDVQRRPKPSPKLTRGHGQHATAPAPPHPFQQLPQELIDQIIDKLCKNIPTLKSCSLTCRRWLPRSSAHLFASYAIPPLPNDIDLILATQSTARISFNVVTLTLYFTSFDQFSVVKALPRLRQLIVYAEFVRRDHLLAQAYASMPKLKTSGRGIKLLDVRNAPVFLVDWLLQLFDSVETLRLAFITHTDDVVLCRESHVVKNLSIKHMSVGTLHHLPEILECGALSGLTVDVNGRREGGYESAIHGFMQDIGQNIESYHHIDYSTGWSGPRPSRAPTLSTYKYISSVTLTSDLFSHRRSRSALEWAVVFLASLPANIRRVRLVCHSLRDSNTASHERVKQIDWAALGQALRSYTNLASLEIGAHYVLSAKRCGSLEDDYLARTVVLERLPERLRPITVFV